MCAFTRLRESFSVHAAMRPEVAFCLFAQLVLESALKRILIQQVGGCSVLNHG